MRDNTRAGRNAVYMGPEALHLFDYEQGAWYETPEEVQAGLDWGRRKALLLAWVRRRMKKRLTPRERRCTELYFFEGHTYREIGRLTGTNASSAYRAVLRSLRKLKADAQNEGDCLSSLYWDRSPKATNPEEVDSGPGQTGPES